ncbi:VCBS repeat-containing protein, partial [Geopseudomonas sagittaria]
MGDNKTPITASSSEPSASSPGNRLVRRSPTPMALEQRFVFDGAAAADVLDTAPAAAEPAAPATEPLSENLLLAAYGPVAESQSIAAESTAPEVTTSERPAADGNLFHQGEDNAALREAAAAATQLIQNYLAEASDEQLFVLFHGEQSSPDGQWSANLAQLRDAVANGSLDISLMLLDNAQLQGALAAYTPEGPQGAASIFINSDWLNVLDVQKVSSLLIEEYGHHIDHVLNQGMDTAGDEGQRFAAVVIGADTSAAGFATDNDHATLQIDGESIEVELANLSFSNAYAVNVASTPAGKESNSHDFIATGLGIASISDDTNSNLFSGNDVAAIGINIGGQEYFGWISRPIKSGGVVRGFYFWTDTNFNSLATAQADGNMDGDSNVADNRGFLLVVDQAWFDSLGWKDQAANLKNVGSSSDRVDSALNALLPVNSAPVASADNANATPGSAGGAAVEAGGLHNATSGYTASGNVLSNDLDANVGDTLAVIRAGTSAANLNVNAATTAASGTLVTGQYGNLTIGADGSYQYVVDNANAAVEALRSSTNTLSDTFTYTVADKAGATSTTTLTVTIQGANDTPTATNDYNVAKESLLSTGAYGASDPLGSQAIGNVLSNDSDPDRYGETKAIIGVGVEGAATGTTNSTVTFTTTVTTSGASSVKVDGAQYVYKLNDNGSRTQLFHANGTTPVTVLTKIGSGANLSFTFSDTSALQGITKFSFIDGTKYYDGTIDSTTVSSSTSVLVSAPSGTIAVGMTVGGTNLATAPTVTAVNYDASGNISSITLSTAVAITNQSLTFSAAASAGATLTGQYGSLQLNADGSYTYTPTANNPALSAGQSVVERFAYTMRDGAGATSSATLFITVLGSGANDPNAVADSVSATERGGVANATTGVDPTGNLLDNDTTPSGTKTIVSARSASVASNTAIGASDTQIVGLYGTLTLRANGTYTYAVNNDHASVQALNSTNSLTDTFVYTIENGQLLGSTPLRDSATLTVTIQGANDAPVASDDSATAIEAGGTGNASAGYNPSGNVLGNDSDIDDAASELRVTAVRTGSAEDSGTAGTPGSALAGSYGSLTLAADGNWSYVVDQSNAAVNALAPGQSLTERFNYTVTDRTGSGLSDIATLTITIQGASDTVAVNDVFVNEASEYAVFSVTGGAGVRVSLALSDTNGLPLGDRKASLTGSDADTGNPLQYLDGSTWKVYDAANPPVIPAGGALLVRVAINQDDIHEGNESFSLTATTSDGSASTGIGTINDEGEGAIYLAGNTSSTPDSATLDDDRPTLSIANVSVTEGEPAEFVVSLDKRSAAPISFTPLLASGTAIIGSDTAAATELQYHDGTGWAAVSGPVTIAAGELSVRLRLATVDDSEVEPAQSFSLSSGNVSGTVTNPLGATGTATILDNDTAVAGTPELDLDADNSSTATGADYRTSFTENGSAVAIADSDLSIVDADSANLASATIVLSNAKAGDSLSVGSLPAGISATVDTSVAGQITVTLSGNASKADYQAAIRAITFSNSSDAPDTSDRLVVVKVSDGASESNSALTTIAVVALNDAPTLADTALSLSFAEDAGAPSGAIGSPLSAFIGGIGDPDSGAVKGIAVIGSDETHGTWYYTTDGGNNWQAVGSVSASSALLLADTPSTRLYFKPTANFNGSIASGLTFKAWDRSSGTAGNRADTTLPPPSNSYTSSEPVVIPSSGSTGSVTLASSQTISGLNGPLTGVTITLNGLTHGWPQDLDILLVGPQGQKVLLMSDAGGGSSNAFNNLSLTFDDAATSSLPAVGEPVSSGTFRPTDLADGEGGDSFTGVSGPFASQLAEFIGTNPNGQWTLYISDDVVQFDGGSLASWTLTLHTPVDGPAFSTASDSIAVTVTPINDAPLASGSAILAPVAEDETAPPGASVSSLFAASFDDSTDQVAGGSSANSLAGIAITGYTADATKGDWQYSTDSGNNWITLTSIASDGSALTLQASALLRFLPAADYNGAAPDLTVRLIDSSTAVVSGATVDVSSNGGITAISADTVLLSTNVTAINDAPTGSDDSITTAEDTPKVLSTSDFGTFTDVDGDPLAKVIITTLASNGSLEYFDGTSWVAISRNQEISKADIDAGKLRFAPAADENGSPYASVGFKVSDGTATSSAEYTLTITVTPANDDFSDAGETLSVAEDSGATTGSLLSGSSSVDGPLSIASFSLAGQTGPFVLGSAYSVAGQGSITINADGSYSFTPAANWNGSFPVITYVVTDGSGANDSSTLTITVDPVNDAPVSSDDSLTIDEDTAVLLTIGDFGNFTDVDGDAITKVRITALATNGSLEYFDDTNWNAVLLNQEINKADIDAGKLRFVPGANENGSPYGSIGFKVSDGAAFSISANTLTIHVRPVSDPAVITGTNTGAVTEDANVDGNGKLNASGSLTISDADTGEAKFQTSGVVAAPGTLGSLTIDTNGAWTYNVANSAVQYLKQGETKLETFTVRALDGTTHQVVVTIHGVNDAALIGGTNTGAVTEDANVDGSGKLNASGSLNISDADNGEASFHSGAADISAAPGTLGSLTIDANGAWSYSVANSAVQYLKA